MATNKNGKRRMVSRPSSSSAGPGVMMQLMGLDTSYMGLLGMVLDHMDDGDKRRLAADERFQEWVRQLDFFRNGDSEGQISFARLGRPSVPCVEPVIAMAV